MWTKEQIDKKVDSGEGLTDELKQLFKEYPEKKEAYKEKLLDSQPCEWKSETVNTVTPPDNIRCKTCMFRLKEIKVAKHTLSRHTYNHCAIYTPPESKPYEVLWENAPCEFYEKAP